MTVLYAFEGVVYQIKKDPTKRNNFYCVMQDPFVTHHSTVVLHAGSVNALKNKINKQYKKFKIEKDGK